MKRRFSIVFLSFLLPVFALAYVSPGKPAGFVNDFAGMLSPQTKSALEGGLSEFEKTTGNEIVIATVSSLGNDETIETYAEKLFQEWGIGKEKEDNGLLLLISRDDRKMRIEVGYGLEPIITDLEASHIISDVLVPAFKAEEYDAGVRAATQRIILDVSRGMPELTEEPASRVDWGSFAPFIFFLFIFLSSILARSKSWWAGGVVGGILGWIFFHAIIWTLVLLVIGLVFDFIVSRTYKTSKARGALPPWWIGGGSRGPGSGGFGGFGGGSSGGGGASGSW